MHQETLDLIGRAHTVVQTKEAFLLARECGFDNINMDMITGLPGEDISHVHATLDEIFALRPESLTVHSLACLLYTSCSVAIIKNASSSKMGKKDIIKIADNMDLNLDVLGYILSLIHI